MPGRARESPIDSAGRQCRAECCGEEPVMGSVVVAVDGTSGSGKSSTSREVARRLGLRYLDTGAMFRAVTWWMLQNGVDVEDAAAVAERVEEPTLESGTDPESPR